ncbi:hypothetical protein CcCBS67573_g06358 [Chytriomyces confervae]|uniref:Epg5-like TPR domain-containing protein n=1 Tax=Chytriomyces confervae TaxID=246404 RepID=A0A507F5T6_9FUNG|nr:hypothetical protein CcCBS67573_g06358 [Chytriomyces confervae]
MLIFNVSILVHSTLTFAAVDQINLATCLDFQNIHQKLTARCEDGVHLVHIVSSEYPTLVVGSSAGSWYYATIPSTIRRSLLQIPSETEFVRYAVLAPVAESEGFGKPIELFSIYRVAALILDSNGLHPKSPLLIQIFISLYFKNARKNPIVNMNSCFGFRFFIDNRGLLDKLSKKPSQQVADLTAAEPKGEVLVFKPTERDHLASILKASLKWLLEPRLLSSNNFMGHLDPSYCSLELNSIMHQAPCLFNDLWIYRVPVLALREGLQQINSSRRFQHVISNNFLVTLIAVLRSRNFSPGNAMDLSKSSLDTDYLAKLALLYVNNSKQTAGMSGNAGRRVWALHSFGTQFDEVVLKRDVKIIDRILKLFPNGTMSILEFA